MNTDLTRLFRAAWHLLSDVPGWSEPPLKLRLRRLLPIALPLAAALLLLGWSLLVHRPGIQRTRTDYAPLIALEDDVRQLQLACSEEEARSLSRQAQDAAGLLLPHPAAAPARFEGLRELVARHQWLGAFKDYQPVAGPTPDDERLVFVPAIARMMPAKGNPRPFPTLLALLSEFSTLDLRIDLTRLAIRVDEQNGPVAEINFRIASLPGHEEAPQ